MQWQQYGVRPRAARFLRVGDTPDRAWIDVVGRHDPTKRTTFLVPIAHLHPL